MAGRHEHVHRAGGGAGNEGLPRGSEPAARHLVYLRERGLLRRRQLRRQAARVRVGGAGGVGPLGPLGTCAPVSVRPTCSCGSANLRLLIQFRPF
jgi:hypothetical protein